MKIWKNFDNLAISERVLRFAMQRNKAGPKFENSKSWTKS